MDLVIDANVLIAVLIKEGFSYDIIFSDKFHLFAPEYVFTELEKHKEETIDKTERSTADFFRLIEILKRRIILVPLEEVANYVGEAEEISPDSDDMVYFALALKLNCPIWSNDKKLKEQNKVKVYHTHELGKI